MPLYGQRRNIVLSKPKRVHCDAVALAASWERAVLLTRFAPDAAVALNQCTNLRALTSCCDSLRRSDNELYALRVTGRFERVRTRAVCRTKEGVPLVQAAAVQPEFEFSEISGTLVGFWSPEYARSLNVPGYHLHFLSDDHNCGGHLLQCSGINLRIEIQPEGSYHIALPETEDFLKADLHRDPAEDLARARASRQMQKRIRSVPKQAMEALVNADWPGNIRELENFIERCGILTQRNELNVPRAELKKAVSRLVAESTSTFEQAERQVIVDALKTASGRVSGRAGAAERLGLKRTTLQNKMRKLNISRAEYSAA